MRREYVFAGVLALLFVVAVVVEVLAPRPVDWTDSFEAGDTRPYGSDVLVSVLPDLFPRAPVESVDRPPYLHLRDTTWTNTRYLFVTREFAPDPVEAGALLDYVARGNVLFVAASVLDGALSDSLGIVVEAADPFTQRFRASDPASNTDSTTLQFAAPSLQRSEGYRFRRDVGVSIATAVDTSSTTLLASIARTDSTGPSFDATRPVLLRRPWKSGAVVVATTPRAFTNVHLLREASAGFASAALSYVPTTTSPVFWDAHHKPLAVSAETPLRYVLSEPALRTAWWLLLAGVVVFVVMQGRRRQRIIPVVEPPSNATVEFAETVGGLYHRTGTHADLARNKIRYFLASLRESIDVSLDPSDEAWAERVQQRTGVPSDVVDGLARAITDVRRRESLDADGLRRLDDWMHRFQTHRQR